MARLVPEDPATFEAAAWAELAAAVRDREHAWRQAALATLDPDLGPCVRTVVLREADAAARELLIYTDTRSPKVRQLCAEPRAELLCWSRPLGWQLRLRGLVEVVADGLEVTARWARLRHTPAAQDYLSPLSPGSPWPGAGPEPAAGGARGCFGVLRLSVRSMDGLWLGADGHRRMAWALRDGAGVAQRLVP
ncbi:MAG: hypothetical protein RL456_3193 [Pseudomonadota bacterium]|jgi:hypothetical protein